jgi:hypothetical protein
MNVHATIITPTKISYACPECWSNPQGRTFVTNRGKDGRIIRNRKPTIHFHGNAFNERKNQVVARTSHCIHTKIRDVFITIDDKTVREGFPEPTELIEPKDFVRLPMVE